MRGTTSPCAPRATRLRTRCPAADPPSGAAARGGSPRGIARGRRAGFALIAALWLLVALSAVGLDAALRSKTRRLAAANVLDQARARAAAEAGAEYAASRLNAAMMERADELRAESSRNRRTSLGNLFRRSDPFEDPWRDPSELVAPSMQFGDARYELRVYDLGASIDINQANEQLLRQFFAQGMRVDAARADRLALAILDWRDEDEIPRVNGAEREQYLRAGAPVLPTNRPFAEIDELRHVIGMTEDLFLEVRPYLRLTGTDDINVNAAPEPVLLALPGMTPGAATELLRRRESGELPRDEDDLLDMLPAGPRQELDRNERAFERMTTYTTNEVEIIVEGWVEGSPIRSRVRVILTRSNTGGVVVWRKVE